MDTNYTDERNVQMLIYLMKEHGIRKVIASPGTTNITFVASIQQDEYFEVFSAADERSAAYIACGLSVESGEPVALSCTGATASRNYISALTEAYYRKIPILAITSTQHIGRVGQLAPQVIDRSVIQKDIAVMSVHIPTIHDSEDEWDCNIKLNSALLALTHRGGGPVHINLTTTYSQNFHTENLPQFRTIKRVMREKNWPDIDCNKKVAIFVGAHFEWTDKLTNMVDKFCDKYNAVVFCEHNSNYHGEYKAANSLVANQLNYISQTRKMDLLIDLGEVFGAYLGVEPAEVWRVSSDGQIKDTFRKITHIFDMEETTFFEHYNKIDVKNNSKVKYIDACRDIHNLINGEIPELPFSNAWIASVLAKELPKDCVLHLGILNSLRTWNFFDISDTINCYSNTGGFGIDGIVSAVIGGCLAKPDTLHFCVLGDLAFFYDMNSIANYNVLPNLRLLVINNGCGVEFKNYTHFAHKFGDDADLFMAAKGHYGNKSPELLKHYTTDLGFMYLSAHCKEDVLANKNKFLNPKMQDRPMLFEIFTNDKEESDALYAMNHIVEEAPTTGEVAKKVAKSILGDKGIKTLKKIVKR